MVCILNKQKTKVTVGIPTYNNEKFIRKAIDSVLSQTFSDFELIISDDASTDSTPTICDEYKHKDDRIHFIRQEENKGAQWNFSFLVDQAKLNGHVAGARMMGGGFGGCTINLVLKEASENFKRTVTEAYKNKFNRDCSIYAVELSNGTELLA